jgi:rhodanese-related sulfurtransferase
MTRRILLAALSLVGCASQDPSKPKAKDLSADELKGLLTKKVKLFFLDVRERSEIEELGTIAGHVNIPISQLETRLSEIPRDVLIVVA